MAISDKNKERLDNMNKRARDAQLGSIIQTAQSDLDTAEADIVVLEGLVGGFKIVAAELVTTSGGAASEDITVTGALATDVAMVVLNTEGTSPVTIVRAAAGENKVTVEFSADPSTDHVVNVIVIRPAS